MTLFIYWVIYAFLGWIVETLYVSIPQKKFVERGFLFGPIIPIYAFGALIILYFLKPFSAHPLFIFTLGTILTSVLEYITSFVMEKIFDMRWWDYSERKFNINGRICLRNSVLFGLLSVVLVTFIHPSIKTTLSQFSSGQLQVFAIVTFILVLTDFIASVSNLVDFKKYISQLHKSQSDIEAWLKEHNVPLTFDEVLDNVESAAYSADDKVRKKLQDFTQIFNENKAKASKRQKRYLRSFPNIKSITFQSTLDKVRKKTKK